MPPINTGIIANGFTKKLNFPTISGMIWLRKGLVLLLSLIMLASVVGSVSAFSISYNYSTPAKLKTWLTDSGVYDHVVDEVLQQAQNSSNISQTGQVSLSDAVVQQAAHNAFPSSLLRSSINQFLDGNYMWLRGHAAQPSFSIDLTSAKQNFANQVGQYVATRTARLPVCSINQLVQLQNTDPLTAPCRPATISASDAGTAVTQQLANSNDFLNQTVINASAVSLGGQPYYQKLSTLPSAYQWANRVWWLLAAVAAVCALLILLISLSLRRGLRRIAVVLVEAGILLLAVKLAAHLIVPKIEAKTLTSANVGQLKGSLTNLIGEGVSAVTRIDMWAGVGLIIVGILIVAILIFSRRSSDRSTARPAVQPVEADTAGNDEYNDHQPTSGDLSSRFTQASNSGQPQSSQTSQSPRPKRPRLIQ